MGLFNAVMALSGASDIDVVEAEPLRRHTTYRLGGPAALYLTCHSYHALRRALEVLDREGMEWVILGKGSNLLVADAGYAGAVITLGREFSRFVTDPDTCTISAGAGALLSRVVNEAYSRGLTGLEFAVGVPGTLGGAVSMNAGTRERGIGSVVEDVLTLKPGVGLRHYAHDDVQWGYRTCTLPRDEIVLEATVKLAPGEKGKIRQVMEKSLDRRRKTQPLGSACCGSVFKNPADMSVGKMIEDCGLKGFSVGGAEVSPIHANFIVNTGTATAADVASVIKKVHEEVQRTTLREAAALESEAAGKQSQLEALEQEISRQRERNAAGAKQLQEEERRIEAALREEHSQRERQILEREELKKEEAALRPRRIRFAKSEPTDLQPYTIILSGNALHRLGPGGLSCREVEVRREGNLLTLIPRNGVPVSGDIGSAEFSRLFADVDRGRYFVRCFVDPDSFEVFAGLRRRFRENGFRLDWIITEEFLLRLVDRADYSASE